MTEKVDLVNKYSLELSEIRNQLQDLKNGKVYEISNVKSDGYISTEVDQLTTNLVKLISKIVHDESGALEKAFGSGK